MNASTAPDCLAPQVANSYDEFEGQTVIDLGCGTVRCALRLLSRTHRSVPKGVMCIVRCSSVRLWCLVCVEPLPPGAASRRPLPAT